MTNLVILPELKKLLPLLSDDKYAGLEKDIVERGCLSPIVVWNDVIVDGHNRYEICQKHGISFEIKRLEFASLDDARLWAWTHQENRRNLTPFQRGELALQFKPIFAAQSQENKSAAGGDRKSQKAKSVIQISGEAIPERIRVDKELAKTAGISHDTMHKVEFLDKHADEETKEQLRQGKTTINREYKRAKEKVADPKPKKARSKKMKNESPVVDVSQQPETADPALLNRVPYMKEYQYVSTTTLKNIPQDKPDLLVANLASHFRKGFIKDLILYAMDFLQEKEGDEVTTPIAKAIAKRFIKTKK